MIRFFALMFFALGLPIALAEAKDCKAVETAPGVKTRPVGCADFGRELTARKLAEPDKTKGIIYNRNGTTVRVNGSVRVETGVMSNNR